MRKNYFLSAALVALVGMGLVGCSDNPDRITNVNEVVQELVDFGGFAFHDQNGNGSVDSGEGLSGVIVTVHDPFKDTTHTATTSSTGRFDFTNALPEGSYNITFTDSSGTVSGAIVSSVEYFHNEAVVDLTQPGDGADGTPERGAVSANFSMMPEPILMKTNLGDIVTVNNNGIDISGLTELTFTFNKPVTVINDPVLFDITGNKQLSLTLGTSAAADIKGATVLSSNYTTVAYKLPTLDGKHTFRLTWRATDYKAVDSGKYGPAAAPTAPTTDDTSAAGGGAANASTAAQTAAITVAGALNGGIAFLNTGTDPDIVTATNRAKIESVVDGAAAACTNTYDNRNAKVAIFAPKAYFNAALTNASRYTGGAMAAPAAMTRAYKITISNVQSDLEYMPIVSYDGGTIWYYAGNAATWTAGNTATNKSLTLVTGNLDALVAGLPRPYYLVKGFYNTNTTEGQNYTRLAVAIRKAGVVVVGNRLSTNAAFAIGDVIQSFDYSGTTQNGIDKNTDRATDTWVNLFDGDLTDYRNRGFNRVATVLTGLGDSANGLPYPDGSSYRGSSYPFPLYTNQANAGMRSGWFSIVEDYEIKTDLVGYDGNLISNVNNLVPTDCPANALLTGAATGGLRSATDFAITGIEEAASATLNANDNPNPALGSKATVVYVYFNEPMDSTTITTSTNWRVRALGAAAAPAISKVEYSESLNTGAGLEVFRAKVTLSGSFAKANVLELALGALKDKNGNYAMCADNAKPTGYLQVFYSN